MKAARLGIVVVVASLLTGLLTGTASAAAPVITSFNPSSGPVGTQVDIWGSGFTGATDVAFNGTSATFALDGDIHVITHVPIGATTGPISVTTADGTATSSTSFLVGVFTNVGVSQESPIYLTPPATADWARSILLTLNYFVGDPLTESCAPANADRVRLRDQLPAGVTYVSDTLGGASYDAIHNRVVWHLGTLDMCATFGNEFQMRVAADLSVPDGVLLPNRLSISTSTPETSTADNSSKAKFQVGFRPLKITVTPGKSSCTASSKSGGTDSKSTKTGQALSCSSSGVGTASASTGALTVSGPQPGLNPMIRQIGSSSDVVQVGGVSVFANANGASGAGQGQGSAAATFAPTIVISNPNPFSVDVRVVFDASASGSGGNGNALPFGFPGSGSAFVSDQYLTGGTSFHPANVGASGGGGVFSSSDAYHRSTCDTTQCVVHDVYNEADWNPDGSTTTDPTLTSDNTTPTSFCGGGVGHPQIDALDTIVLIPYLTADATGSTQKEGGLTRSGYSNVSASASIQIVRCDSI